MRTVLIILPILQGGGAERVTLNLIRHLDRSRFRPVLFLIKDGGELWPEVPRDIDISTALDSRSRMLWHLPGIIKKLRKSAAEADIIVGAMEFDSIYFAAVTGWLSKRPVIGCIHADLDMYKPGLIEYWLNRWILSSLQGIITVSRGVANSLKRWYPGLEENRIRTIYNPVDLELIRQQAPTYNTAHESDTPIIVGVGRLDKNKNFQLLIQAHSKLLTWGSRQKLIILGEGPEHSQLELLVNALGLEESVILPGFLTNPYEYINKASVLVMCSRYEGFSCVMLEAMALGVPVVATDCSGGPVEILDEGRYGLLVPSDNQTALAEAIALLLGDDTVAQHYREMGLKRVQQFGPEVRVPEFEGFLEEMC